MAERRFGPVTGPGIAVIQKDNEKLVEPSILGTAVLIGATEKGDPSELIHCPTKESFIKKCGSYLRNYDLPDSAFDFFFHSDGAGQLYVARVTNGTETKASLTLKDRRDPAQGMLQIDAKNVGNWGGKRRVYVGKFTSSTDLAATTLTDSTQTWLVNQWAGATLELSTVSTKTYTVLSNTATAITVTADSTLSTDSTGEGYYHLTLENGSKHLAAELVPAGVEDPVGEFGLRVYLNGLIVLNYENLSMDPEAVNYVEDVVNEDTNNEYITVTSLLAGGAATASTKPANAYTQALSVGATSATLDIIEWTYTAAGTPNSSARVVYLGSTAECVPHTVTVTFTSATACTVTFSSEFTDIKTLPATGHTIANIASNEVFTAPFDETISFMVVNEGTYVTGDVFTITVNPYKNDEVIDGFIYPDYDADRRVRFKVIDNTQNVITVKSTVDLTDNISTPPAVATVTGSADVSSQDFDTLVFNISLNGVAQTHTVSGATVGPAAVATVLNNNMTGVTWAASGNNLKVSSTATGAHTSLQIVTGTGTTAAGITADYYFGTSGDYALLSYKQQLVNGHDPSISAYVDADYEAKLDKDTSPILSLREKNLGLLRIAVPGITSTSVQRAGQDFSESQSYSFLVQIPNATVTEAAADTYVNDTIGRSDMSFTFLPSFGKVRNPLGSGKVTKSLAGAILGRYARRSALKGGYHEAASGITEDLPFVLELPTDGPVPLDEDYLTPLGINVIKKRQGQYILWGARTISTDPSWKFLGPRDVISHYTQVLRDNFDWILFESNNTTNRKKLLASLNSYLTREWRKGVLEPRDGFGIEDAFRVIIDDTINTPTDRSLGQLNVLIQVRVANVIERVNFAISQAGIDVSIAT